MGKQSHQFKIVGFNNNHHKKGCNNNNNNKITMKKLLLSVALFATCFTSFAKVGIGTSNPNASAALDIISTTGGLLMPRMTFIQLQAISNPINGLLVFVTDYNGGAVVIYDGANGLYLPLEVLVSFQMLQQ